MQEAIDFKKRVDSFREVMESEMERPEIVQQSKEYVDELVQVLSVRALEFIEEKNLNGKGLLPFMVAHRAFFFMGSIVTYEWLTEAVAARMYSEMKRKGTLTVVE
jgi:hypothetical protein